MEVLEKLKELIREKLNLQEPDEEDGDLSGVGVRMKPKPRPGASSIALGEPD